MVLAIPGSKAYSKTSSIVFTVDWRDQMVYVFLRFFMLFTIITLIFRRHPKSGVKAADHSVRVVVLVSCQNGAKKGEC